MKHKNELKQERKLLIYLCNLKTLVSQCKTYRNPRSCGILGPMITLIIKNNNETIRRSNYGDQPIQVSQEVQAECSLNFSAQSAVKVQHTLTNHVAHFLVYVF